MPSSSPKQHRFMEAIAHNPQFAAKAGVAQSVGKDFAAADDAAGITKKPNGGRPHSPNQREFFRKKGFTPSYGIIDAQTGMGKMPTQ